MKLKANLTSLFIIINQWRVARGKVLIVLVQNSPADSKRFICCLRNAVSLEISSKDLDYELVELPPTCSLVGYQFDSRDFLIIPYPEPLRDFQACAKLTGRRLYFIDCRQPGDENLHPEFQIFERPAGLQTPAQKAIIVDLDGTFIDSAHRTAGDNSKAGGDKINLRLWELLQPYLWDPDYTVIFLTARGQFPGDREVTFKTLAPFIDPACIPERCPLIMFANTFDDPKQPVLPSAQAKYREYCKSIAYRFNVIAAFDDDPEVLQMWDDLGILALQIPHFDRP